MFVLDSNFKQCPNEVKGEIYIGGLGLASGYYGDKELTEEKFLYNEELEERLFRTGDIGYYTKNGILMICGRKDNQIKINGNRVEIGEIESVIKETKEVTDCTVVYHKEANKASGLFAFLEPRKSVECTAGHLEEAEVNKLKRICTQRFENINREDFMKWKKQSDKAALADMFALFSNLGLFNERDKEYGRKEIHSVTNEQKDIKDIDYEQLLKNISIVFQKTFLTRDTVLENIRMGNNASLDEVRAAAKKAQIDDFIMSLPEGYYTKVGSFGTRFSGGEKQRIAIARAILKNAPILILDEATSAADPENQVEIDKAISNLCKGKTVLIVAHRLGAIKMCDKVAVVENHSITAYGTHEMVLEKNNYYRTAWQNYNTAREVSYSMKGASSYESK